MLASYRDLRLLAHAAAIAHCLTPIAPCGDLEIILGARQPDSSRPRFHFTPPHSFMNDPNGLVYFQGEYHLFYQHNPVGDTWGHMSWGHAVSPDLLHWTHLPVALPAQDGLMIFSGSAVVDWRNSSRLAANPDEPCLVAIYTGHAPDGQTQNLAYSSNRGRSWTKYSANPVLTIDSVNFRDPKVFWHGPTGRWVMVVALSDRYQVRFYASADLKHWQYLSEFGPAGATGGMWECPDLFPLCVDGKPDDQRWVLKVDLGNGAVAGGSGGQYFIGAFDGTRFVNEYPSDQILWLDYGKDFYAAQTWSDMPDGRRVWLGWMSNWEYANVTPTTPWRGMLSTPRELHLKRYDDGVRLVQHPAAELQRVRQWHYRCEDTDIVTVNQAMRAWRVGGAALEIRAEFELAPAAVCGVRVRKSTEHETVVGYNAATSELFVDRTASGDTGFAETFPGRHAAPLPAENGAVTLHILIDHHSVEVFGNDGRVVITDLIFPGPEANGFDFFAGGAARVKALDIWTL